MSSASTVADQVREMGSRFEKRFGRTARFAAVAPGRVNLIGEHTDYNDGFVLPMAIERQTVIVADKAPSRQVRLVSSGQSDEATFIADANLAPGTPKWANYVRGVVAGCLEQGLDAGGFDALIDSTVPLGGGLSSSASLEVATATLIEAMAGKTLDPVKKALLCQHAEHRFAMVPCGIMDQFISALGEQGHAMLLDCRSRQTRMVPLADPKVSVLIANTNVKHELSGGEYAQRRAQCEAAAKALDVTSLRDVTMKQLVARKSKLDPLVYKRAFHVVGEIARTIQAADEMVGGFWVVVGRLMHKSHVSLRDDYQVSCPELDTMVELAMELDAKGGVYGSRMTGGGFGGCTVTLVKTDMIEQVARHLHDGYRAKTGIEPTLFATRPAAGARVLPI